ncbi:MAG: hypothetical protein P1P90_01925 [Patescibacteria group bacterium]|nr:hypothetical protein [Patescibacteria group bacterium]
MLKSFLFGISCLFIWSVIAIGSLFMGGCGGEGATAYGAPALSADLPPGATCVPGEPRDYVCEDGKMVSVVCAEDGMSYSAAICPPSSQPDAGTTPEASPEEDSAVEPDAEVEADAQVTPDAEADAEADANTLPQSCNVDVIADFGEEFPNFTQITSDGHSYGVSFVSKGSNNIRLFKMSEDGEELLSYVIPDSNGGLGHVVRPRSYGGYIVAYQNSFGFAVKIMDQELTHLYGMSEPRAFDIVPSHVGGAWLVRQEAENGTFVVSLQHLNTTGALADRFVIYAQTGINAYGGLSIANGVDINGTVGYLLTTPSNDAYEQTTALGFLFPNGHTESLELMKFVATGNISGGTIGLYNQNYNFVADWTKFTYDNEGNSTSSRYLTTYNQLGDELYTVEAPWGHIRPYANGWVVSKAGGLYVETDRSINISFRDNQMEEVYSFNVVEDIDLYYMTTSQVAVLRPGKLAVTYTEKMSDDTYHGKVAFLSCQ